MSTPTPFNLQQYLQNLLRTGPQLAPQQIVQPVAKPAAEIARIQSQVVNLTEGIIHNAMAFQGTVLGKATDGLSLGVEHDVANGTIEILISIDVVWATNGTYRFKQRPAGMAQNIDIIEDRGTHTHYLGYIVCEEGTQCLFTQGATVSGTGTISGTVGAISYVKRR